MKLSIEQANEYLQELGLQGVQVVADEKEAEKDFKAETLVQQTNDTIREIVRGDIEKEITETRGAAEDGKAMGLLRSAAARIFGGVPKDYEGLDVKGIVSKAKENYNANNSKQQKDWEEERDELISAHEKAIAELEEEWTGKVTSAEEKYIQRDIDSYFMTLAGKVPTKGGELSEHADTLQYKARKQYDLKWNSEKNQVEFYTKDGKLAMNGNKPVDHTEFAKETFTKLGTIATGTQHLVPKTIKDNDAQQGKVITEEKKGIQFQGVAEMEEWANQE